MSEQRPDTNDYLNIFLNDLPLMDLRAPVEFNKGAFPGSNSRPLLDDDQRHLIGCRYKHGGQSEAIKLGEALATPEIRQQRMSAWNNFIECHPNGYLYCFRGGLRSQITQQWLRQAGINYPRVIGGYKAMRNFLLDEMQAAIATCSFLVVGGRTGTGKTRLLLKMPSFIDLEGLANHRGSSFGKRITDQPSQISFENRLAIALLKKRYRTTTPIALEDESRLIGRCALPEELRTRMQQAPMILVDEPLEDRVENMVEDYVTINLHDYQHAFGEEKGFELYASNLRQSLFNIRKRLGGERYQALANQLNAALHTLARYHSKEGFRHLIEILLLQYYDPMYDYQLGKKQQPILMRGSRTELLEWSQEFWCQSFATDVA